MAGLKRVTDQNRFRNRATKVAEKVLGTNDLMTWAEDKPDDAFEDDGNLHVTKHGLHVVFGLNQDNGKWSNEKTREILAALGMKKHIGKRTLTTEECEACDGSGYDTCGQCSHEHTCDDCDGNGYVEPEDYK
jgi:hypothetical protein